MFIGAEILFFHTEGYGQVRNASPLIWEPHYSSGIVLPWLSSVFFRLFIGFFVTENAVLDITIQKW